MLTACDGFSANDMPTPALHLVELPRGGEAGVRAGTRCSFLSLLKETLSTDSESPGPSEFNLALSLHESSVAQRCLSPRGSFRIFRGLDRMRWC